jgi:hypothetical protein
MTFKSTAPVGERRVDRRNQALERRSRAHRTEIRDRADSCPKSRREGYLRAAGGIATPREAIKAFCLECVNWSDDEVRQCPAGACSLWLYRPYQ